MSGAASPSPSPLQYTRRTPPLPGQAWAEAKERLQRVAFARTADSAYIAMNSKHHMRSMTKQTVEQPLKREKPD